MNGQQHWVLLRGLGRDSRHWEDFPKQLQNRFPKDRITLLNIAGSGSRWRETSAANIAALVDDLRQHFATELHPRPLRLIGISMGGMMAADWASRYSDEIQTVIAINSSSRLSSSHQRFAPSALKILLLALVGSREGLEKAIVGRVCNAAGMAQSLPLKWANYQLEQPCRATNVLRQLIAAGRFNPPSKLTQPTLILASECDRLVNPGCSRALAAHWGAELRMHSSAGHDLPLDDPEWLLDQLATWSQSLAVSCAAASGSS